MAAPDPAVVGQVDRIRKSTMDTEAKIAQLIGLQNQLLLEQEKKAGSRKTAMDQIAKDVDRILKSTNSLGAATPTVNNYATSTSAVGNASSNSARSIGSFSDVIGTTMKGVGVAAQNLGAYREQLENLTNPHVELAMQMKNLAGGSLAIYRSIGEDGTKAADGIAKYYEKLGRTTSVDSANERQIALLKNINEGNKVFKEAGNIIPDIMSKAAGVSVQSGKAIAEFNAQGMSLEEVMGGVENVLEGYANIFNDVQLSSQFARDQLRTMSREEVSKDLATVDFALRAYNISNADVTEMIRKNYTLTGKATTSYFHEVVKAAEIADQAYGISAEQIIQDTLKMSSNIQMFGFRTPAEFARLSKAAQDAKMSVEEMSGVLGKFDTFESASQTVGDLNAMLGTNLDAVELMTLKYTDPEKAVKRLGEGLRETGQSFEEMFMSPERLPFLVATMNALSVSEQTLRAYVDGGTDAIDNAKAQADAAREVTESGIKIEELTKSRISLAKTTATDIDAMTARLDKAAQLMAGSSREVVKSAQEVNTELLKLSNDVIGKFVTQQKQLIDDAAKGYKDIIDRVTTALEAALKNSAQIITEMNRQGQSAIGQMKSAATVGAVVVTPPPDPAGAKDLALSPGAPTKVSRRFGEFFEEYLLDPRDAVIAGPPKMFDDILMQAKVMKEIVERSKSAVIETSAPPVPAAAPPPAAPALPAFPSQLAARMLPVGTDLNITIDGAAFIQYVMATMAKEYPV